VFTGIIIIIILKVNSFQFTVSRLKVFDTNLQIVDDLKAALVLNIRSSFVCMERGMWSSSFLSSVIPNQLCALAYPT
jgi:hypothetical protein